MKQTGEKWKKKSLQQPWAFVLFAPFLSSHSSHFFRLTHLLSPLQTALKHIGNVGGGRDLTKTSDLECKTAFGRVLKPTINIYTHQHILSSTHNVLYFVHPSVYSHLILKKVKLPSYCKTNVSD